MKSLKNCFLDSNILIAFKIEFSPFHTQAIRIITQCIEEKNALVISPLVLDETIHSILQSYRIVRKKFEYTDLRTAITELLLLPTLTIINPPTDNRSQLTVIEYMKNYKLRPRDAYHLLTIKAHEIDSFATFDRDFERVFEKGIVSQFK
ncbi:type II toxin-antitoxin system VapC family toxin [Candidatus Roizmanbacteria bacterium]|nr:type II toxin-antitoxin system VapC family toxin [Candidatus Roizmanbacteria bacterium]